MNRPIKFRAFNLKDKTMHPDKVAKELLYRESKGEDISQEWIISQYTGINDKDGKEIYECDIVHAMYKGNYEVIYSTNGFIGIHEKRDGNEFGVYTIDLYYNPVSPILSIVGNIYSLI